MAVKVFGPFASACTQRVLACLMELGEDFELIHVDLATGEHKQPEFLVRQPFGQVPAIEDGDFRLFESRAIIRYLAAKHPDRGTKLLGTTLQEKAVVDQWLDAEANNFNEGVYNLVLQLLIFPLMGQQTDHSLVATYIAKLEKVLDVYEQRLSKSRYIAGESFTMADLSHLPGIRYIAEDLGLGELITRRKNVNAWWEDISSRPAWKKVMMLNAAH